MPYKAFISYSHAADDKLAPAIQSALQSFAKAWYKRRAIHFFRDKTTLAMTPKLWPALQTALMESEYFLLLASPDSARSTWVQREVECWLTHSHPDKLLIVVTGSSPIVPDETPVDFNWIRANLIPAGLREKLPSEEPLYLDFRWAKSAEQLSTRNPRFVDEMASIVAALSGRAKDELIGEDVRQHRRLRRLTWTAAVLLIALTITSTMSAVLARWQRDKALARQWVATSSLTQDTDPELWSRSQATPAIL